MSTGLNYFAILLSALAAMIAGALWYSPALFGRLWLRQKATAPENLGKPSMAYGVGIILHLATAFALAVVIRWAGAAGPLSGGLVGLMMGLGLIMPTFGMQALFEGRPLKLYLLNTGHFIVAFILMGVILGAMP